MLETFRNEEAKVLFCRHPDFTIRCKASILKDAIGALIALDGDTITIVAGNDAKGVALDVETEATAARLYEVDIFGSI